MAVSNLEKDCFFLDLVKSGKLGVTEAGIITNMLTGRRIGYPTASGYPQVSYFDQETKIIYKMLIHRLVWLAFRGPIPQGIEVNHKNETPSDPSLDNLELATGYGNLWYSKNGRSYDSHLHTEKEWVDLVKQGWSCNKIGKKYGLSGSSVSRRLKKYNLEKFYKANDQRNKLPDDMMPVLLAVKEKGYRAVAKSHGVMPATVRNWFAIAKIEAPRFRALRSDAGKKKSPSYPQC